MKVQATADSKQFIRLFFALWPDDATREALQRLQTAIAGRRTAYGNLHITLAFLGRQPASQVPALLSILNGLSGTAMPLIIDRVGYFSRNRIAWAGMHAVPPALHNLQRRLDGALAAGNIAFDRRTEFKPHITLARDADAPLDLPFDPFDWEVRTLALVHSVAQAGRHVYKVVAERALCADDAAY